MIKEALFPPRIDGRSGSESGAGDSSDLVLGRGTLPTCRDKLDPENEELQLDLKDDGPDPVDEELQLDLKDDGPDPEDEELPLDPEELQH